MSQLILDKHANVGAQGASRRLDTLREMANQNAARLDTPWSKQKYAALMWAIAELSGVADEIRQRNLTHAAERAEKAKARSGQLKHFQGLCEVLAAKNAAYKAENHRLRMELDALQKQHRTGDPGA